MNFALFDASCFDSAKLLGSSLALILGCFDDRMFGRLDAGSDTFAHFGAACS
jgi:hypothetical protein